MTYRIFWKKGEHLNHVTIYRILDLFCDLNLAHKVLLLNGFVKCSLGEKEGCHRFMVCRSVVRLRSLPIRRFVKRRKRDRPGFGFSLGAALL